MAFRRRRRTRGQWLPIQGTQFQPEQGFTSSAHQEQYDAPIIDGEITAPINVPVAYDQTLEDDTDSSTSIITMKDLAEGQDYYLDRIVGKVWGELFQTESTTMPLEILLCAAFAILPTSDGQPLQPALSSDSRNPLKSNNSMDPWIWRRTWKLYNNAPLKPEAQGQPVCIAQYGSVMDGGHVDAKTRRRVRHNERLFFVSSALCLFESSDPSSGVNGITIGFDVRLHGGMRRHRNRGSFQ